MKRFSKIRLSGIAGVVGLASIAASPGGDALAQAGDREMLDEIVVIADSARTGTKTDTKLTEIPQSISVVTADLFNERGSVNFQDVFRYSAGVSTEREGIDTRSDGFAARGFAATQFLDGLNRNPEFVYGARTEVYTLERAEILRGPSAVLYGAGGAGGILNAVSKLPKDNFAAEFGIQFGSDDRMQAMADVTGAISDTFSGRVVGLYREGELQPEGQADDRQLIMPSIMWRPTADTYVTALVLFQKDELGTQTLLPGTNTIYASNSMPRLPIDFFAGDDDFNRMNTDHLSGTLMVDHSFNDTISYSGRMRYFDHDVDYGEVWGVFTFEDPTDGTQLAREFFLLDETYQVLTVDNNFLFNFTTGPFDHTVLMGVDYTEFEQDRREGFSCGGFTSVVCSGFVPEPLDLSDPNNQTNFVGEYTNAYATRSTQTGFYFQDQIRYQDRLSLVLGVRRDKATSARDGLSEPTNNATSIRVGAIADLAGGFSPYVGYSESFLPIFGGDFFGNPYEPQEGEQIEAGVKWQPDASTLVTFAVFDIEESNRLTVDPDNLQNQIQTGKIEATGFEVEATTYLFDSLLLTVAYSDTDAEIAESNDGNEGLKVENLPERLASLWAMYSFREMGEWNLRTGVGVRYVDSKLDGPNVLETPSETLVDLSADAQFRDWRLMLSVTNLLNEEHYAFCGDLGAPQGFCWPAIDRRVIATVTRRFD